MELLKDFLTSRKAQALGLLVILVGIGARVGLSDLQIETGAQGLMAFILGRAIHDNGLAKLTEK